VVVAGVAKVVAVVGVAKVAGVAKVVCCHRWSLATACHRVEGRRREASGGSRSQLCNGVLEVVSRCVQVWGEP
jgi:hypothetical protein